MDTRKQKEFKQTLVEAFLLALCHLNQGKLLKLPWLFSKWAFSATKLLIAAMHVDSVSKNSYCGRVLPLANSEQVRIGERGRRGRTFINLYRSG